MTSHYLNPVVPGNFSNTGTLGDFSARYKRDLTPNDRLNLSIVFRNALIYGAEGKLEIPHCDRLSAFASDSCEVGSAWNPVTGGLFLGDDATAAETQLTGHFPDSQDQRNTVRARLRCQPHPRVWLATGFPYDTGLPFEFDGDPATVLAPYGQAVLNRLNFTRGRIDPALQLDASAGADLHRAEHLNLQLQIDDQNLTNILNVIDSGGFFSGNAIGPSRNVMFRLKASF